MILALITAAIIEALFPRRPESVDTNYRWTNNLLLSLLNQINLNVFGAFVTLAIALWAEEAELGLFRWGGFGFWPSVLLTIATFEFINYWFHRAMHTYTWLWRVHVVHHSDTDLDFTTTYRNHPFELYMVAPLTIPAVLLLGFPPTAVVMYQVLRITISIFGHSNIRLPEGLDRWLRYIIITPDYHRVHHSSDQPYTDSNFAAAFPVYDYLFGTARTKPFETQSTMELGLEYYRERKDSSLINLLLMPFLWQRSQDRTRFPGHQGSSTADTQ